MVNSNMSKVKIMVLTAIFAALSIVVGFVEIPWPPMPFLKVDFSEVIILVALLAIGFPRTVVVIVLRSVIRQLFVPKPFELSAPFVGEVMAILGSIVIIGLFRILFSRKREVNNINLFCLNKNEHPLKKIIKYIVIALGFSVFMTGLNYFVTIPMFLSGMDHFHFISFVKDPTYAFVTNNDHMVYTIFILSNFLPFNLVKGVLTMVVFDILRIGLSQLQPNDTFEDKNSIDSEILPGICEDESLLKK